MATGTVKWFSNANGNHPFGALLVDADGKVVLEGENTVLTAQDCTGHAETNLMRMASERFGSVGRLRLHAHARLSDPKPPRSQNPKRDSSKGLKRRFSETVLHLAAGG